MTKESSRHRWALFDDRSVYIDRFGLLLIVTTLAVITLSLIDLRTTSSSTGSAVGQMLVSIFVGATLLLSLRASGVGHRLRATADILVSIGVVGTILLVILTEFSETGLPANSGAPSVAWVILSVVAPVMVVRRLVQHREASGKTLLGAVSAYLLIALAFNFAFLTVDVFGSSPFFGSEEPTTAFMYYSLVTITTLGFGDLSPVGPFGRLLTTVEAVVGQVYLVTFVGMIVGLLVAHRMQRETE
jgi:Ion channel